MLTQTKNKIITLDNKLKRSVELENARKEIQAVACIKPNPKYFYKYAANKLVVRGSVGPLTNSDGRTINEFCALLEVHNVDPKAAAPHTPNAQSHDDALLPSVPLPLSPSSELQPPGVLFLKAKKGNPTNI